MANNTFDGGSFRNFAALYYSTMYLIEDSMVSAVEYLRSSCSGQETRIAQALITFTGVLSDVGSPAMTQKEIIAVGVFATATDTLGKYEKLAAHERSRNPLRSGMLKRSIDRERKNRQIETGLVQLERYANESDV